jgi:hypothetical protein
LNVIHVLTAHSAYAITLYSTLTYGEWEDQKISRAGLLLNMGLLWARKRGGSPSEFSIQGIVILCFSHDCSYLCYAIPQIPLCNFLNPSILNPEGKEQIDQATTARVY